jgi:hypothetical protein
VTAFARRYRIDSLDSWQRILRLLSAMRPDCEQHPVILAVYEEHLEKTGDQRRGFHYLCGEFGKEIGLTPGQAKHLVKVEFYGVEVKTIRGKPYEFVQSSEDSDRAEYSRLIDFLYQFAAEQGCVLPDLRPKATHG